MKNPFRRTKKTILRDGHQMRYVFTYGGTKYYELVDIFDMPCQRAFAARAVMEELNMRTTKEYLIAHVTAINNILAAPKTINIPQLAKLNTQLQERLELIHDSATVYKLAAVYFFDETENPYNYSYEYGFEKIAKWKKAGDSLSFFLLEPVKNLAGLTVLSDEDLSTYLMIQEKVNKKHLDGIFTMLSESDKKKDFATTLQAQMQQG